MNDLPPLWITEPDATTLAAGRSVRAYATAHHAALNQHESYTPISYVARSQLDASIEAMRQQLEVAHNRLVDIAQALPPHEQATEADRKISELLPDAEELGAMLGRWTNGKIGPPTSPYIKELVAGLRALWDRGTKETIDADLYDQIDTLLSKYPAPAPAPARCGSCPACELERIGCACDGAIDYVGCFVCDREIARPACPKSA